MQNARVLVIEDDRLAAKMVEEVFRIEGFQTTAAFDGEQGLDKIHRERPDLVTLDIIMPKMDGWEVLRRVRAHPATKDIPVIVVSAKVEDSSRIFGLQQGADDYVTKPFNPLELAARAKAILKRVYDRPSEDKPTIELGLIPVRSGEGFSLIDLADVYYFDTKYGYACAHTYSEEFSTGFTLAEVEKRLNQDVFFRAHRGQIVNLKQVKEVVPVTRGSYILVLRDDKESHVSVSRRRLSALKEHLGL